MAHKLPNTLNLSHTNFLLLTRSIFDNVKLNDDAFSFIYVLLINVFHIIMLLMLIVMNFLVKIVFLMLYMYLQKTFKGISSRVATLLETLIFFRMISQDVQLIKNWKDNFECWISFTLCSSITCGWIYNLVKIIDIILFWNGN